MKINQYVDVIAHAAIVRSGKGLQQQQKLFDIALILHRPGGGHQLLDAGVVLPGHQGGQIRIQVEFSRPAGELVNVDRLRGCGHQLGAQPLPGPAAGFLRLRHGIGGLSLGIQESVGIFCAVEDVQPLAASDVPAAQVDLGRAKILDMPRLDRKVIEVMVDAKANLAELSSLETASALLKMRGQAALRIWTAELRKAGLLDG